MTAKRIFHSEYQVYTCENNFPQARVYRFLITLDLEEIIFNPTSMDKEYQ